jgi:hypothetical protein
MIACRPGAEREPLVGKWMPSKGAKVIIEERAIHRIQDIRGFFPSGVATSRMPLSLSKADVVVGGGLLPSGVRARKIAAKYAR